MFDGEVYDARKEQAGWDTPGFDDSAWSAVQVADYGTDNLVASESEPVVTHEIKSPVAVITTPAGEKVLDFGQNLVGREILTFKGKKGQEIVVSHAEVLDEKGNFYTVNLRSAKAQSRYICSGGEDRFEPTFTFYGFRYLKVEGIEGELDPENFKTSVWAGRATRRCSSAQRRSTATYRTSSANGSRTWRPTRSPTVR